jgi:hypothetical protein
VCRNVSRVTRVPPAPPLQPPPPDDPLRGALQVPGGSGGMSWAQRLDHTGGQLVGDPRRRALDDPGASAWPTPTDLPTVAALPTVVEPVPEPGTWALMLAGLAGVWAIARRKRSR